MVDLTTRIRQAHRTDIIAMHRVRCAVRENKLTMSSITESDYVAAIEDTGRGWVAHIDDAIVGFAVGNAVDGNIWALFIHPDCEGRGLGRQLHDLMVAWLFAQGLKRLWLTTDPATRARRFYEAAGWRYVETVASGESLYELYAT